MNLTIAIDDVNPLKGWRIFGDKTEKYLFDLNKTFGVKFTLFIPSNYHNEAPISNDKNWINDLKDSGIFELAAHGHYHQTSNPKQLGEMEFAELNNEQDIEDRIKLMFEEWNKVGIKPLGWRNPGWICHPLAKKYLEDKFEYAALHYDHNNNLKWKLKEIFGADGIHETNITTHKDNIMLHSHICGDWNDNVWNENNYKQLNLSLEFLFKNYKLDNKTIAEL